MLDEQNKWNALLTVIFVLLVGLGYLSVVHVNAPHAISTLDLLLITSATFRITRLFVYDHITQWIRDVALDVQLVDGVIVRCKPARGLRRTFADLLGCPWCLGVWASFCLTYLYFRTVHAWFFILILAIAGLSTLLQLLANLIGWSAEYRKIQTEQLDEQ
jgi:hypothetical protein